MWICAEPVHERADSFRSQMQPEKTSAISGSTLSKPKSLTADSAAGKRQTAAVYPNAVPRNKGDRAGEISARNRLLTRSFPYAVLTPYYIGLAVSGLLLRACSASQKAFFQMVAQRVFSVFRQDTLALFGSLFLTAFFLLSLTFFTGFSLFGQGLSACILCLYGLGTGILCLQALQEYGWQGWMFFICVPGIFAAVLAWNLGRLNSRIRQFSSYLLQLAGQKENPPAQRLSGRVLVDRYLVCCCVQIICCGVISAAAKPCIQLLI